MKDGPRLRLCRGDDDRVGGVLGEGAQVARVAGEHRGVGSGAGVGGDDGVGGGDRCGLAGGGAQPCCFAGAGFGDVADLAGSQQPVGVKVPPVVPGQRLGQDGRGTLGLLRALDQGLAQDPSPQRFSRPGTPHGPLRRCIHAGQRGARMWPPEPCAPRPASAQVNRPEHLHTHREPCIRWKLRP